MEFPKIDEEKLPLVKKNIDEVNKNRAYVSVTFGPKYARGYSFDLIKHDETYMLDNEQLEWVS